MYAKTMIKFKAKTATREIINSALSPFTFPAGEAHTKHEERRKLESTEIAVLYGSKNIHNDLFQLRMWMNLVNQVAGIKKVLVIPYFPGARADRGHPWGADIYAKFVADMMFDQIILFDPHSEVIVERLNFHKWPETEITVVYPHEILKTRESKIVLPNDYDGVIAPDAGAVSRAGAVADEFEVPLYEATKVRDFVTGKLSSFQMNDSMPKKGSFLVVDDICDGGGTFIGLAEAVRKVAPKVRLDLYVSHGVFSNKALEILPTEYNKIATTNSYNPTRIFENDDYDQFRRIDVIRPLLEKVN